MGCYENKEMRQIRNGFFLMATAIFAGGILVILAERVVWESRLTKVVADLYGEFGGTEFWAFTGERGYGSVWIFSLIFLVVFASYFFYMTGRLSKICGELRQFSLCLEQMTAGRRVSLAEWKEGILAALSNQAELLYLRNRHMVDLVQEEKERLYRFTENMVHQMKTPLTAIRLDLELMETKLSGLISEAREIQGKQNGREKQSTAIWSERRAAFQTKLEDCLVQCDRLQENVDEFLLASRLAAGKLKLILRPVRMEDIVEGACAELAPVLEKRGIRVSFSSESELPLFCDCNWMRAAVANILKNSSESMETGGTIEIRHWDENRWKYLEILDGGGGISEEAGRHLFERFYTGRQKKGGTGLGLSITKEVVEASHGTISAVSAAGRKGREGTRFLMKFRILDGPEAYE